MRSRLVAGLILRHLSGGVDTLNGGHARLLIFAQRESTIFRRDSIHDVLVSHREALRWRIYSAKNSDCEQCQRFGVRTRWVDLQHPRFHFPRCRKITKIELIRRPLLPNRPRLIRRQRRRRKPNTNNPLEERTSIYNDISKLCRHTQRKNLLFSSLMLIRNWRY